MVSLIGDEERTRSVERPRLILADDDAVVRSVLEIQLLDAFECVGLAADAAGAVDLAAFHKPDVVILDVDMPAGGAKRATREIRVASPGTAIVILSVDETDADIVELLSLGAMTYLRKGIEVRELITKLRGSIEAHGKLHCALDTEPGAVPPAAQLIEESDEADGHEGPGARLRVAIADDDPFALLAVQAMIGRSDRLDLVGSAEGVDAIVDLVAVKRPDVVVLDWMMPEGGGPEAAMRIGAWCPDTRIVALTSSRSPQASIEMSHAGAHRLLVKGCSAETLARTITTVVAAPA